jgi:hypothetical protein
VQNNVWPKHLDQDHLLKNLDKQDQKMEVIDEICMHPIYESIVHELDHNRLDCAESKKTID